MEKLHLLCNAHLDPAWLWRWNEGLAEAISTFRVAADFCEKYDCFIFNHNEALLYEWVEEHEPQLFERIKKLVKENKWKIMGGWYLQPDCVMTSGESLMEQIRIGNEYFMEKFGVKPTIAINFDPFGHTRGLVQILKNAGYEGYLFMRPDCFPGDFLWEGFDGSRIVAHGLDSSYLSKKGHALNKVTSYIERNPDKKIGLCLWGIGNHGGGPSKIDLEALNNFISVSELEVCHSSAEGYFAEINTDDLTVIDRSLVPFSVGCYTSMVRIKQANRRLENKIALTEKAINFANMNFDKDFDQSELLKAKKALAFCQFHDILPGSAIRAVEEDSLKTLNYGEEITDKLFTKAFLKLCDGQPVAAEGEIPIMVFNPHPYEIEGEFEVGFLLQNQNWNEDEYTIATVYDENGNPLPTQNEKPDCTFHLDWTKKISFKGTLAPSSVTRFDCKLTVVSTDSRKLPTLDGNFITVKNDHMTARINRKTGLLDLYEVDGKTYIKNSGRLEVFKDDEDPWGMLVSGFPEFEGYFKLLSDAEANSFRGYPDETLPNVAVIEDGEVRTKIQAIFGYARNIAVVEYTIPKNNTYIDVDITMFSNTPYKMIKYTINTELNGTPYGETAFGSEPLFEGLEKESVFHKWCGIKEENDALYVINNGTYGGSFSNDTISLSLLRTPLYSGHPIGERQRAPHDRYLNHIDMGERQYSFRITNCNDINRQAQIFNEKPQLLSFFPSGNGKKVSPSVELESSSVILSSIKQVNGKYIFTLYNTSDDEVKTKLTISALDKTLDIVFGKHELKTIEL